MNRIMLVIAATLAASCGGGGSQAVPADRPAADPSIDGPRSDEAVVAENGGAEPGPSANPGINDRYKTEEGRARSIKIFEDPERSAYQKPGEVLDQMKLRPGDVVADVGGGSGYMTAALSKAVGPKGKVYAQDIQAEFLEVMREKVKTAKLSNVEMVLGTTTDAKLPEGSCDVVLVLDVYHHFEWPKPMMASIRKALKPGGRVIIIDFYRRQNDVFAKHKIDYKAHVRFDRDEVVKQIEEMGWRHVETKDFLPFQYFAVFTPRS